MKPISILIILLQLCIHQPLLAQCCDNITYKPDPKVRKQFDYFGFSLTDYPLKLENGLLPEGSMTVNMGYWSDWNKSNPERVFQAIQKGLYLLKDSINDPLNQHVLTIALSADGREPLYRFKKTPPETTDFVEINAEVLSVKHRMDSIVVADYFYKVLNGKDSSLHAVIYIFTIKDLSVFNLSPEWRADFDSLNAVRKKGLGFKNFTSRLMLIAGAGIGVAMNGTAYPALDGGLYYNMASGPLPGTSAYFGYGASLGYAGFNGNRGLYLFHGVDIGAFSGNGLDAMTVQKIGLRLGAANIKPFEKNGTARDFRSAAYMGITFPLGKTINFSFDFASNFRFTEGNHVGYFGGKLKFYFRVL